MRHFFGVCVRALSFSFSFILSIYIVFTNLEPCILVYLTEWKNIFMNFMKLMSHLVVLNAFVAFVDSECAALSSAHKKCAAHMCASEIERVIKCFVRVCQLLRIFVDNFGICFVMTSS